MSITKNFVAVDWRTGPDRIYFFFPEKNSYSRFDFEDNKVLSGFPKGWSEVAMYFPGIPPSATFKLAK